MRPPARLTAPPRWLAAVFVLAALPVLIWLALFVPVGEVPDEVAHVVRADSVRRGVIAGTRQAASDDNGPYTDVVVLADPALLRAGLAFASGKPLSEKQLSLAWLAYQRGMAWQNQAMPLSLPNAGIYPPILYLPAAAALQAAQASGRGPFLAIIAVRLVNAGLFCLLGALALGVARRGQPILLATLCLPMSLSLAASANQDGLVLACAALAAALLTRRGVPAWWCGTILFALAAMAKPYLLPLALIVPAATPATDRRRPIGRAIAGLAVATIPALAWFGAMAVAVAEPLTRGPAQPPGPLWPGPADAMFNVTDPAAQLQVLLADPLRLLTLPLHTAIDGGYWLWRETIGVLGTLDLVLPGPLYAAWTVALAAAALAGFFAWGRDGARRPNLRAVETAAALAGAVGAIWLAFILQYLSWTHVGAALIDGVQGRYFLPIAALALPVAALPIVPIPAARILLTAPAVLLALAGLAILPLIVLGAYFVR